MKKQYVAALVALIALVAAIAGFALYIPDQAENDQVSIEGYRHIVVNVPANEPLSEAEKGEALASQLREDGIYNEIKDRKIKNGDVVNIAFTGYLDGKRKIGDLSSLDYDLEIGSGTFIEDFEKGLVGKMPGKKVELDLSFPLNYPNESYAGHKVKFVVKVHYIKENYTADTLKDEVVAEFSDFKTAEEYVKHAEEQALKQKRESWQEHFLEEMWKQLIDTAQFKEVDEGLLEEAYGEFDATYESYAQDLGISVKEYRKTFLHLSGEEFEQIREETCVKQAKKEMLVKLLAEHEKIKGDSSEEVEQQLEKKLMSKMKK